MKVTIFGVGYVGLVQGAVLSSVGHNVLCVDKDINKINNLKNGIIPIYEPGLTSLVVENQAAGRLQFSTDLEMAVNHAEMIFVAVGTPPDENGAADLQYVLSVTDSIGAFMESAKIIVNKSTVPVGTADQMRSKLQQILSSRKQNIDFDVISNPEFLKEGSAVNDCLKPDRIIIGSSNKNSIDKLRDLYAPFNRSHEKIIEMDTRSAELTKYAANCLLATKISFINEMANLAEKLGADIESVRQGIGADPRIGYQFIYPGCGYGGSCFPKDIKALITSSKFLGHKPAILEAVESVNNRQKNKLFDLLFGHYKGEIKGRTFALWGLSFKPNTDDMREASSRVLMESLWQHGAKIQAYDPKAADECSRIFGNRDDLTLVGDKESALKDADALIICTEWSQFKTPDFKLFTTALHDKLVFDGRNLYDPVLMQEQGIDYYAIGRGLSVSSASL